MCIHVIIITINGWKYFIFKGRRNIKHVIINRLFLESAVAGAINCLVQQAMLEGLGIGTTPEETGGIAVAVQWVINMGIEE